MLEDSDQTNMVLVKVYRISSIADPETGKPGKQIELVEAKAVNNAKFMDLSGVGGDEARLIKNMVGQFKSIGILPQMRDVTSPKMTLYLTEAEYDLLSVRFEVNEVYDLIMKDGAFMLKKPTDGI